MTTMMIIFMSNDGGDADGIGDGIDEGADYEQMPKVG